MPKRHNKTENSDSKSSKMKRKQSEKVQIARSDESPKKKSKVSSKRQDERKVAPEKKSQKNPKKDPNAPKKPISAFMYFTKMNRSKIVEQHPDVTFAEVSKIVAKAFKALNSESLKEYENMANEDKERYKEEMKTYVASSEFSETNGEKQKGKDRNAPKKYISLYNVFCRRNYSKMKEENPDASFVELSKLLGAAYKKISDEEKEMCQDEVKLDKERYEKEMEEYKSNQ